MSYPASYLLVIFLPFLAGMEYYDRRKYGQWLVRWRSNLFRALVLNIIWQLCKLAYLEVMR